MLRFLRNETAGGFLLLLAAIFALFWANLDPRGYFNLRELEVGLSLGHWAADGLLAIFFFVAGMELKRELTSGALKDKAVAAIPIAAAIGGMLIPALIFIGFNAQQETSVGWGIPMATDIAFALAVLAVAGKNLPLELRAFLLTLAVVDDLGAILVIAVFYTSTINLAALAISIAAIAVFGFLQSRGVTGWYFYLPLALSAWAALLQSGVHATVAGVALGLLMNVKRIENTLHIVHPISAGIAVPIFAFFTSGVSIQGMEFAQVMASPLAVGVIAGLVLGKPLGILLTSWTLSRFTKAKLSTKLTWWDVSTIGILAGVGFTVSLLINELAFKESHDASSIGTLSVLIASTVSAVLAVIAIQFRKRAHSK